jgi:hypothetical protein
MFTYAECHLTYICVRLEPKTGSCAGGGPSYIPSRNMILLLARKHGL